MIAIYVKALFRPQALLAQLKRARWKYLHKVGKAVIKVARRIMPIEPKASPPGEPPHSHERRVAAWARRKVGKAQRAARKAVRKAHKGQKMRRMLRMGIRFGLETGGRSVLIGTSAELVEQAGKPHEMGGVYKGQTYPKRPFMKPSLDYMRPKLRRIWRESVIESK